MRRATAKGVPWFMQHKKKNTVGQGGAERVFWPWEIWRDDPRYVEPPNMQHQEWIRTCMRASRCL